jgi:hypothetical protein
MQKKMKFFLTSAYNDPVPNYGPRWLMANATSGVECLVSDPREADVIIFVERYHGSDPFYTRVLCNPVFRKWSSKCLLYHTADHALVPCRTITPSNERQQWGAGSRQTFHYVARIQENEALASFDWSKVQPTKLYSFQGSCLTHPVRRRLFEGAHPDALLIDTSDKTHHTTTGNDRDVYEKAYVATIADSHFVLCPRGFGPCTYRLFEVMQMGRVPVIMSDDWIPIADVPWHSFSIRIGESDVKYVPEILADRRFEAEKMGLRARQAWEEFCSPEVSLSRLLLVARKLSNQPYGFLNKCIEVPNILIRPFNRMFVSMLRDLIGYRRLR